MRARAGEARAEGAQATSASEWTRSRKACGSFSQNNCKGGHQGRGGDTAGRTHMFSDLERTQEPRMAADRKSHSAADGPTMSLICLTAWLTCSFPGMGG
jgi:hypothetical protein